MIFIVVASRPNSERTERWPDLAVSFTAPRAEEATYGSKNPQPRRPGRVALLVEPFRDGEAGGVHVNSDHQAGHVEPPKVPASTPKIISQTIDATVGRRWGEMTGGRPIRPHVDRDCDRR